MGARVFFDFLIEGETEPHELWANIRQPIGGKFEETPIEVSWPVEYKGLMNYEVFREEVENYYREQVGGQGRGITKVDS